MKPTEEEREAAIKAALEATQADIETMAQNLESQCSQ